MSYEEVKNKLPVSEGIYVELNLFNSVIEIENFIKRFNGADLTYDSLYSHESATEGWKEQFEDWKEKGILD